jgi:hypothetical protein
MNDREGLEFVQALLTKAGAHEQAAAIGLELAKQGASHRAKINIDLEPGEWKANDAKAKDEGAE